MNPFEKVNTLLNSMETLINEEKFDIDNEECSALKNGIVEEIKNLGSLWTKHPDFETAINRFDKLWDAYEPIEDDERSVRDIMYPEGEDNEGLI
jgi:replication fork clamp-binding protein CrfC